ncbi:MAG: hypothetical protein AAFU03_06665 [Bacteroidota bacterium]
MTLLNYLEAAWHKELPEDQFDEQLFSDMHSKAEEVLTLTKEPKLITAANHHLEQLRALKQIS